MDGYQNFKRQYMEQNPYATAKEAWNFWQSMTPGDKATYGVRQGARKVSRKTPSTGYQRFKADYMMDHPRSPASEPWSIWKAMSATDKSFYEQAGGVDQEKLLKKCQRENLNVPDGLKCNYLDYINTNLERNNNIPEKTGDLLRIATFNIHYFTDVWEEQETYNDVLDAVQELNPDIIILQEAIIGGDDVVINEGLDVDVGDLYKDFEERGYLKLVVCNSVPAWFPAVYGNILLVKEDLLDMCLTPKFSDERKAKFICEALEESIYTFGKSEEAVTVAGGQAGTQETRCYIYIKFPFQDRFLHIYGTHLDVGNERTRAFQIDQILDHINTITTNDPNAFTKDVFVVLGDFNTIDPSDYAGTEKGEGIKTNPFLKDNGAVVQRLKNAGFTDANKNSKITTPEEMTTWSNVRVDFIFIRDNRALNQGGNNEDIINNAGVFFTDSSDHIPVFVDLNFGDTIKKVAKAEAKKTKTKKALKTKKTKTPKVVEEVEEIVEEATA